MDDGAGMGRLMEEEVIRIKNSNCQGAN